MRTFTGFLIWSAWILVALFGWMGRHSTDYSHAEEISHGFVSALWFWSFITVLGWSVAKKFFFNKNSNSPWYSLLISAGLGLGMYAALILIFGTWVGVSFKQLLILHVILSFLLGSNWMEVFRAVQDGCRDIQKHAWTRSDIIQALALGFVILSMLPFALTPNFFSDTLRYHFGLTHLFQTEGHIFSLPDFAETNLSLNWQMLYLGQLVLSGETCVQFFNWFTLVLIALGIMASSRILIPWLAIWTMLSTPFLLSVSAATNNDLGVAFFCVLMWMTVRADQTPRTILLAGIFGGLAVGTKYPALLAVGALGLSMLISKSDSVTHRFRILSIFILGATIGYAPWFIRNIYTTGDPFYPSLSHWLPRATESGKWVADHYARELSVYGGGMEGFARWIAAPWRATMADSPWFESDLGLIFWTLIPLLIWGIIKSPAARLPGIATIIFASLWAWGPQVTRFLAAGIPAFIFTVQEGWYTLQSKTLRKIISGILVLLVISNVWFAWMAVTKISNPFAYFLQRESREEYLAQRSAPYRMSFWLEKNAPKQKVLLIGVEQVHFFKNPVRISGPFDRKWVIQQAYIASSYEDLKQKLIDDKIQWICLNRKQMMALDNKFGYISSPSWKDCALKFWRCIDRETELVKADDGFELRKITSQRNPNY